MWYPRAPSCWPGMIRSQNSRAPTSLAKDVIAMGCAPPTAIPRIGGHKWVVLSVMVKLPFAIRPWALPVLVALYRGPEWAQVHGTRHKTPAQLARLLLVRVVRWFPHRHFIFIGDTSYG